MLQPGIRLRAQASALALVSWLAVPAHAQSPAVQSPAGIVAGVVLDDRTNQPIKGVSISVDSQSR